MITEERRRRVLALCSGRCPDHGHDLEEVEEPDGDQTGTWISVHYRCPESHTFGSAYDRIGGYFPVEED